MGLNILKNADIPEDPKRISMDLPDDMIDMMNEVGPENMKMLTSHIDLNNLSGSIGDMVKNIADTLREMLPPGTDLDALLQEINEDGDGTALSMPEILKQLQEEEESGLDLKDPYFFKNIKATDGLEEMFPFKKEQKYSISELKIDKFNILGNPELTDFPGFLSTIGAVMFMPRLVNNHIAICQFGAPKVPSIFVVIYRDGDELKAYISSAASGIVVKGTDIARVSNDNTPDENYYEALNEAKNVFRFEKNVVFPLAKVGCVELTSDVDSKDIQLGKIHFHDTVEARLIKSDLYISEGVDELEIYISIVDPFSKEVRKISNTERNKWKDYISFMNLFDFEGNPLEEGKLKFNDTELSKELPVKIIGNRLFIELDFGRINL